MKTYTQRAPFHIRPKNTAVGLLSCHWCLYNTFLASFGHGVGQLVKVDVDGVAFGQVGEPRSRRRGRRTSGSTSTTTTTG